MLEQAYRHSPVAVQNLMVSGYGLVLYWRRLASREHRRAAADIASAERLDERSVRALQNRLLGRLVRHAAATVPYYQELFTRLGLQPGAIDADHLPDLPLLGKQEVRQAPERFWSSVTNQPYTINTSGTTGSPLAVRTSRRALLHNYAHFYHLRERLGVATRDRCATFAGRTVVEPDRIRPPFWRHNLVTNTILYSTYHLSPQNMPAYLDRLARQDPVLLDTYPSALGILGRAVLARPELEIRPRAIITSSETLLPHQRRAAEDAFDCRVTDQYGSAEMSAFIAQCELGKYHVWPTYGICELLVGGRAARPGESGELVTTGFINDAMPLIRYRTGDTAVMGDGCGCGLPFMALERIEGRLDDLVVTPDGREVGRLDPIFKGVDDDAFHEVQIIQTALDRIVIRFVPGSRYNDTALAKVRGELARRVGPTVIIEDEAVAELPRAANGKLQAVIGLRRAARETDGRAH